MLRIGVDKAVAGARVCALRYDKRGVGASGGDYLRAGMDDRRADARAALGWLAARAGGLPLLAIGASEGAWYAAELAADDTVSGAVLLGGGARPAEEILSWQSEMTAARLPATARMILKITRTDIIGSQRKRVARIKASTNDVIRDRGAAGIPGFRINARWLRDFLAYNPRPALARIKVPVLAITGGQDVQVPPQDVAAIGRLVQGPFEGHVAGDLSHLFRPDPASAGPRAYRRAVRARPRPARNSKKSFRPWAYAFTVFGDRPTAVRYARNRSTGPSVSSDESWFSSVEPRVSQRAASVFRRVRTVDTCGRRGRTVHSPGWAAVLRSVVRIRALTCSRSPVPI